MTAVLRLRGAGLDVDGVVGAVPANLVEKVWRAGELDLIGRLNATSGVTLLLSEAGSEEVVVEAARAARTLTDLVPRIAGFLRDGAEACVDFALFVSAKQPSSIAFEPAILRVIAEHGLQLEVSAYPVEDDDDHV